MENDKTYTQEEVNKIVEESLAEERNKLQKEHSEAMAEMEQSIKARELRMNAVEKLQLKGLPSGLVDALNCSDEETLDNSIEILSNTYKQTKKYGVHGYSPTDGEKPWIDPVRTAMGL